MKKQKLSDVGKYFDYSLLIIVLFLVVFGWVMVYSTSSYVAAQKYGDAMFFLVKQLKASAIGLGAMIAFTLIPYHIWKKLSPFLWVISVLTIFLVVTPLGISANGASRWVKVGPFSFQPAEFVKLGIIMGLAWLGSRSGWKLSAFGNSFWFLFAGGLSMFLIFKVTNNLSSGLIILGISYVMYIVANPKPKWILIATVVVAVLGVLGLVLFFKMADEQTSLGFRFERLLVWRNPENYASGTGYQTLQALYAIGSGGFWGKGLGASIQKLGFIPEAQNDMIFSVICEELGLFGGICVIILFLLLLYRLVMIANNTTDRYGVLIVTGVMAHIAIQVVLNIAVVTNVIPNTGVSLPFISYGGTSIVFLMIEMGLALSVSRQIRINEDITA